MSPPTLYKARQVPTKQPVCAICVERTRGRTKALNLGYGVVVSLCAGHSALDFQRRNGGRDFALTLQRLWTAHGCLTARRSRALRAHLDATAGAAARPRPGSYAWPGLRLEAERLFAGGAPPWPTIASLRKRASAEGARPPSVRTMLRWYSERRWLAANHETLASGMAVSAAAGRP